ncbi:MAG: beta-ketoacyl synthase N-terminal-like domain-containing protein [Exilibacterium sp.]
MGITQPVISKEKQEVFDIQKKSAISHSNNNKIAEKTIDYIKGLFAEVSEFPLDGINVHQSLENYGINSIMVIKLTAALEKDFGPLSKTLFFEFQSLAELGDYFINSHRARLLQLFGIENVVASKITREEHSLANAPTDNDLSYDNPIRINDFDKLNESSEKAGNLKDDIVIVGLAGRYAKSTNMKEFWRNLCEGKSCITEIPKLRWDNELYFDQNKSAPGKIYSKWGGFLDGVDEFDPLFFNISPREAEFMDPQERLFLQCACETLEDAGYTRDSLGLNTADGADFTVGVYVGVMYEEYQLYGVEETIKGRPMALSGNPSSVANRVSYFCNFGGPSLAVDSMCSSSLTAIHLACMGIRNADCDFALAGGVNVSVHYNKYLMLSQGNFLSSKGRCESFGSGGDGYVPGEGVGAILLKRYSKAIEDRDHIYGIIRASAINHGGKSNGYSVPNPKAQSKVIELALKRAGVNPRELSYLEAHGTGTSLGDPIEISALNKVFRNFTKDNQFCAIGSVKSNIGHCESAAGIAGISKVLLQI